MEVEGKKQTPAAKDDDALQEVMLSRIIEFEGPDFAYTRMKQFQRSLMEFISSDKIPKEELYQRQSHLLLTLSQMRTSAQVDLANIKKFEAEGQEWKTQSVTLQGQVEEARQKLPTPEQERNEFRIEVLETLLLTHPDRYTLNTKVSQLNADIAKFKVQERVLRKIDEETKRGLSPLATPQFKAGIENAMTQLEALIKQDFLVELDDISPGEGSPGCSGGSEVGDDQIGALETLMKKGNDFLGDWNPLDGIENIPIGSGDESKGHEDEGSTCDTDKLWSLIFELDKESY